MVKLMVSSSCRGQGASEVSCIAAAAAAAAAAGLRHRAWQVREFENSVSGAYFIKFVLLPYQARTR